MGKKRVKVWQIDAYCGLWEPRSKSECVTAVAVFPPPSSSHLNKILPLLIFGCAGSLLPRRLFCGCGKWGLPSSCGVWAPHCGGLSCFGARALGRVGFSSSGTWDSLPCSMWNLPGRGIKPVSPALAGRVLTTGLPGKSSLLIPVLLEE